MHKGCVFGVHKSCLDDSRVESLFWNIFWSSKNVFGWRKHKKWLIFYFWNFSIIRVLFIGLVTVHRVLKKQLKDLIFHVFDAFKWSKIVLNMFIYHYALFLDHYNGLNVKKIDWKVKIIEIIVFLEYPWIVKE